MFASWVTRFLEAKPEFCPQSEIGFNFILRVTTEINSSLRIMGNIKKIFHCLDLITKVVTKEKMIKIVRTRFKCIDKNRKKMHGQINVFLSC